MPNFDTDIRYLKGVGEKRSSHLKNLGIDNIGALLRYYPRDYEQVGEIRRIFDCLNGEKVTVCAKILTEVQEHFIRKNMTLYRFKISDGSGVLSVTIFNNKYLAKRLNVGAEYLFTGKIEVGKYDCQMSSPKIRETADKSVHPVYRVNAQISSKQIEKLVKNAFSAVLEIPETLPQEIVKKYDLMPLCTALAEVHFPSNPEILKRAKYRLAFEELFVLKTGLALLKDWKKVKAKNVLLKDWGQEFKKLLPFTLTAAQERVISECVKDMMSGYCLNRLVEGDVGSGKTVVAAYLMYNFCRQNVQSAIMAPTEILAEQHFDFLCGIFKNTGIKVVLLTGSVKKKQREEIKAMLLSGEAQIAVGTHALISEDIKYKNLGLVVTDEQHRFGVSQRSALSEKGLFAHTLVMSATPIPRTLGLVIYGDLDLSRLDEYPKGRKEIKTYLVSSDLRKRVYGFVKKHLDNGLNGYIVCPAIEENAEMPLASAQEYYESLKNGEFSDYAVGLLHGKMKPKEKEAVMGDFKSGKIRLLVCTTVIEVGIDVKTAAIMVIENAERFGLSALHQLRGRVGRGSAASSCVLISDGTGDTKDRLSVITKSNDGFKIAEEDLRLRGPGDFLGERQHGLPQLKIADIYGDRDLLLTVSGAAKDCLLDDPRLEKQKNAMLRNEIKILYKQFKNN